MTLEQTINDCERLADQQEAIIKNIKNNLAGTPIKEYIDECSECSAYSRQIAEWLTELKEWKANPFSLIKTECKNNYYCNKCAFLDHCPFSNGNRVAAEHPMDWVVY